VPELQLQTHHLQGAAGPHLLITGGVHGDEFEPMVAIRRLRNLISPEPLRGRVTLVPVVNEPAFRRGERTAEDGLDLARTCPGKGDGTVTEQIACALSRLIRSADFYIDLHTGGTRLSVSPLAGYTMHPDPDVLTQQRRMANAFNLPIVWGSDPRLNGRSLSVARDAGVPAIYTEYLGGGGCSSEGVAAYVDGCLNVLGVLGMLDRPLPASRVRVTVEDDRPNAGFLQLGHPAPKEGCFIPDVKLGDRVQAGDRLGTLSNLSGTEVVEISAAQSGLVIVLRTFPSVAAGDSLAVVLEDGG
jgi:predicted deacylase